MFPIGQISQGQMPSVQIVPLTDVPENYFTILVKIGSETGEIMLTFSL